MKTVFRWLMSWIFCAPKKPLTGGFRSALSWTAPNQSKRVRLRQIASHQSQNCTSASPSAANKCRNTRPGKSGDFETPHLLT